MGGDEEEDATMHSVLSLMLFLLLRGMAEYSGAGVRWKRVSEVEGRMKERKGNVCLINDGWIFEERRLIDG